MIYHTRGELASHYTTDVFVDALGATRNKSNNNIRFDIYIDSVVLFVFHVLLFLSSTSPSIYEIYFDINSVIKKYKKKRTNN
jgi:hypothetical protein